jgi:hypothetical protein
MQKVIDIFPPQKSKESYPPIIKEEVLKKEEPVSRKTKKGKFFKRSLIFLVIPLVIAFVISHLFFAAAEIKIWPETEMLNADERVTIDGKTANQLDLVAKVIPGDIIEIEKVVSGEFSSSGQAIKKAEGTLRLYNAYSTKSEVWLAGTRFVSSEGKLFLSKDKINVPGAQVKDDKITPSFVDVPVIAAEGGTAYNIGPSHFSVFVYRGTPRYTKFYGESSEAMKGGGDTFRVTKDDLANAEEFLIGKAKTESAAALKNQIPAGSTFLDRMVEIKVLEKSSSVQAGAEVEKFNFQIKVKASTISFREKDIDDFALMFLNSLVPEGKKHSQESVKTEYSPETFSLDTGKIATQFSVSGKIYPQIDLTSLKKALTGKSMSEAKILLENQPGISRYEIRLSLPWLENIPDELGKINIELKVD